MNKKGNEFKGLKAGAGYRRIAALFGFGEGFYKKGIGSYTLEAGMKAIDLGCGPGALSFALAATAHPDSEITGIDISEDQLSYARNHSGRYGCKLNFIKESMDELPFENNSIDIVMSSMALHETPPEVRRHAINETARVLKDEGVFILVDWSKPKFGLWGIIWFLPLRLGEKNGDNWNNIYPELCRDTGLSRINDQYINSITRRQVFIKRRV